MGGRRRSIVLAGAFVLAACSSGGDATPSTTTTEPPVTTAVTSTAEGSVTTTSEAVDDPTTTAAPTTTQAPDESTTTTSTTPPDGIPPRVTFPDDPELQAVVDAAYAFFDAARAAQADPESLALRERLARTMVDPLATGLTQYLDGLAADGLVVVGSEQSPTYIDIFRSTVVIVGTSATFDACVVDSDVRVAAATGDVVDDDVISSVQTYSLLDREGSWVVQTFTTVTSEEDQVGCGQ